jgi:prevent-host-death family protein
MIVNMHDAKTNLSKLVAEVESGGSVFIARNGKPVVKLVKVEDTRRRPAPPKSWKGKVWISPDIAETEAEIERLFYGEDE